MPTVPRRERSGRVPACIKGGLEIFASVRINLSLSCSDVQAHLDFDRVDGWTKAERCSTLVRGYSLKGLKYYFESMEANANLESPVELCALLHSRR